MNDIVEKKKSGCFGIGIKIVGIGCLVMLATVVTLSYFLIKKIKPWLENPSGNVTASGIELFFDDSIQNTSLPDTDKDALIAAMKEFTNKIRSKAISSEEALEVASQIWFTKTYSALTVETFGIDQLEKSNLSSEEKEQGFKLLDQFSWAIVNDKIADYGDITSQLYETITDEAGSITVKAKQFTDQEIIDLLDQIQIKVDELHLGATSTIIDYKKELQEDIEEILSEPVYENLEAVIEEDTSKTTDQEIIIEEEVDVVEPVETIEDKTP
ncbi:MAG: hypothetical protein MK193_13800 [Lentisphaeria bacterium]|nr:hypothetical protein [Lentisphaeria bacterium]